MIAFDVPICIFDFEADHNTMFLHKAYYHSKYLDMTIVRTICIKIEIFIYKPKLWKLSNNSTQLVFAKMASNKTNR